MTHNFGQTKRLLPVLCAAVALAITPVLADITPPSNAAQSAPAGADQNASAKKPYEAGAQVVVVTLDKLREVGTDLKHIQSAASHLYDEVTIQQVTLQTEPELINPGMVINIPVGSIPTGVILPAKPKRVAAAMAEIKPIATLLKTDADDFASGEKQIEMPGVTQQQMEQQVQQWELSVNNIYAQLQVLEPLTQSSPYNQPAIAQATWAIVQDVKELDRLRRIMYRSLQREGKRQAQAEGKKRFW